MLEKYLYPDVAVSSRGDVLILPALDESAVFISAHAVPKWLKNPRRFHPRVLCANLTPVIATAMAAEASLEIEDDPLIAIFTYPNGMTVAIVLENTGVDLPSLADRVDIVAVPADDVIEQVSERYHGKN